MVAMEKTDAPRSVTILGSTGSVGCSTIDLIERNPDRYAVEALTARRNVDLLVRQARALRPRHVAIADESQYVALKEALSGTGIEVAAGEGAIVAAAERPAEFVMAAIVGAAGLSPTLAAVQRGAMVGLANKECLVCAGALMVEEIRQHGAVLLPVDSEHNAIFQVFDFDHRDAIDKLILTASGGPFRTFDLAAMRAVTPAQAVKHPNWAMGAKISVDSATMMNKGLEVIEAHYLFDMPEDRIDILVHPQSVIHSLVAYQDGSVLAQLGPPDMRTPIAYALAWPQRMNVPQDKLDLAALSQLTFEAPDPVRFPALRLAREALKNGGSAPTVLSAANEIAVQGFLDGQIGFLDIAGIVEEVLAGFDHRSFASLDDVRDCDAAARRMAETSMQVPQRRFAATAGN
jgi:1-deoxy-D-xylulose-5-phosphate reductoisomerase